MAFQIIRHAFRMIFGNFGQALRVSVGPYLMFIVALVAFVFLISGSMGGFAPGDPIQQTTEGFSPLAFIGAIFLFIGALFVFAWVAVSWHRFILLEEYSGVIPAVNGRPIWPYAGRTILYGFLLLIAILPILFLIGLFGSVGGVFGAVIVGIVGTALMAYLWFRIAIALPAIAVGKPITLGQAWSASAGISSTILGVAFLLMAINGVAGIFVQQLYAIAGIIGFICDVAVQWTTFMLGVSVLTTFYGHLIEQRPLVD